MQHSRIEWICEARSHLSREPPKNKKDVQVAREKPSLIWGLERRLISPLTSLKLTLGVPENAIWLLPCYPLFPAIRQPINYGPSIIGLHHWCPGVLDKMLRALIKGHVKDAPSHWTPEALIRMTRGLPKKLPSGHEDRNVLNWWRRNKPSIVAHRIPGIVGFIWWSRPLECRWRLGHEHWNI